VAILLLVSEAAATTVVPPEFDALVNESDYVVHARVSAVSAEKRVSERGAKIVTKVELEVIEVVAGTPPAKIVLELLGGRVGEEKMAVGGMPRFQVGDEDVLFVSGNGRSICPLYGMMHGRYSVEQDPATGRKFVRRSDGVPLSSTRQITAPMAEGTSAKSTGRAAAEAALGPAEFIREIRAAVKPGNHRAK
jgi:hypothetical protein